MKSSQLLILIQNFFRMHLLEERGLSPNTILSYRDTTKDFLQFICKKKRVTALKLNPKMLTADQVLAFLNHLEKERGLSVRTRNQRLASLKTLFSYLAANDLENIAVFQRVGLIGLKKQPYKMIDYLTDREMVVLLDVAGQKNNRHLLLLTLLYNTGARVQEICDLKVKDLVMGPPPSIYLSGKGQKTRQVPVWPKTAEMIAAHLKMRGVDQNLEASVIVNNKNLPMTRFGALHIIKSIGKIAEKSCTSLRGKRISPHTLRHTTAMHLLQSGVDLSVIKMWLGHVNLNTTHGYVEIDVEMKRQALTKSKKLKPTTDLTKVLKENEDVIRWLESL
jgi:integrase/recombinase XerD